jgi:hypothetical protein
VASFCFGREAEPACRAGKEEFALTAANENLVRAVLVTQLRSIALARLELDSHLLLVEQVGALEDDSKGALPYLLPDAVVDAHDVRRRTATRGHDDKLSCKANGGRQVRERGDEQSEQAVAFSGGCSGGGCAGQRAAAARCEGDARRVAGSEDVD